MQEPLTGGVATVSPPARERPVTSRPAVTGRTEDGADLPVASPACVGIRKVVLYRETVLSESGREPARPSERATVAAVIANPWVGTGPTTDLSPEVAVIAPVLAR